ncbi:MAG: Glycosyltransferase, group 2 family protein [Candidatus Woesebacteria bacterium GW2011_GWB1_43_14]|uniref:Glycosyltransferase, group 2 family protein n=1 Tax=Candidatus Woesebacteria bacterium GW2011_GWB1_43_14 TaxID=1618578 RepID=A0A0G1DI36_9BACT|nr:MAG: Glycosyltransferase, group 2 family protein [Candidatus Woesebacteria bacterium GW2011_GWA1_39_11b]KKS78345.1 MAG: Glycosyltransferase, group 2 family protein [Candidatus Woesebacteria bacterium GW2011_GWC1_42_9]KKS97237.1 MAG: Glycosyltransferase, group 2 family protein [Candidatus Woesebacteria bacterium GW2011_GWB1_43_14]
MLIISLDSCMPTKNLKTLSVIIPAYKEAKTIRRDLNNIERTLKGGLSGNFHYEIICIVDGEVDDTCREAKKVSSPSVKIYSYKINRGKGYAVRFGMKKAKGELISFLDAGRDIKPAGIMMLLAHMEWYGADVIVGSKRHPVSKLNYPWFRQILSIGYQVGIRILFNLNLRDTQSGIKIYKRKVIKKILPKLKVDRFAMDIEMLALARHYGFKRIYEAPIEVNFNKASKIQYLPITNPNSPVRMAWDTLIVFWELKVLGKYN